MATLHERFEAKFIPEPMSGCWLWEGAMTPSGYGKIIVNKIHARAHRVAWSLYRGVIPADKIICHKCDNRLCVNPDHLYCGTAIQNTNDMIRRGRSAHARGLAYDSRGEGSGNAKLTNADIRDIRSRRIKNVDFARMYGVTRSTISKIINASRWRHIQ